MFLKLKISCMCGCEYYINEKNKVTKISCPNCGKEHPFSKKIIKLLNIADEIDDGKFAGKFDSSKMVCTKSVSIEESKNC